MSDRPILPAAILFDMDGTLTRPMLDFPKIKSEMGIGDKPILEAIEAMPPDQRTAAEAILERHEEEAARLSTLNPGCEQLLGWLMHAGIRTALITRNSRLNVSTVLATHGLRIDVLIAREDARPKPFPDPLHLACDRLHIDPSQVWMVGDSRYDIEAGAAAGIRTVWVSHGIDRPFRTEPWRVVTDLMELMELLKSC